MNWTPPDPLDEMRNLPAARCHELKGNRAGSLAVRLHGGWRVVFKPDHDPPPQREDGGLEWREITDIRITGITDYHD